MQIEPKLKSSLTFKPSDVHFKMKLNSNSNINPNL